jgi:hypothetical protein
MKNLIIILLVIISIPSLATNYYVKVGGNDGAAGTSDATAWATISKVNSTAGAGDSVFFRKGDTWREMLSVRVSGTSGSYSYFGSYGTGNKPRILGSKTTTWTDQGGNVWKSDVTFTNPNSLNGYDGGVGVTWFENTDGSKSWGTRKANTGALTTEYDWCWTSDYMYVYAASDPDSRYTAVEVPQRNFIFDLNYMNYVHIQDLALLYCGYAAVQFDAGDGGWQSKTGLIIDGCEIGYVAIKNSEAGYGTQAIYNDMIVRNCDIHNCGRRSLSLHLYGSYTITNILIEDNYFHDGWHTTGVDMSVGQGSGIHLNGIVIRRNKFYDPPASAAYAHHIFMQNYDYGDLSSTLQNVYVYSNLFYYPTGAAINMEGTQSAYIYNNTFYGHSNGGSDGHIWVDNNNDVVVIKNNLFYTEATANAGGIELFVRSGQSLTHFEADYNLYYRINTSLRISEKEGTGIYYMNTAFPISGVGWETHGIKGDPLFTGDPDDLTITTSSPAKSAGVDLDIALDYNGFPFHTTTPSIGAFEFGSTSDEVLVTSITVSGAGGASTITTDEGTLQLSASVLPEDATNKNVTWSISNGTGSATISSGGLVTAVTDGTVTARATANDGSGVYDDYELTISNQDVPAPDPEPIQYGIIRHNGKIVKHKGKIIKL